MNRHCAIYLPSLSMGGAERMMLHLANALVDRGYDVDLVLVKEEGRFLDELQPAVQVIDLDASRVLRSFLPLVSYLNDHQPDVLLSTITPTNVIATWACIAADYDPRHVVRVARPESEAAELQDNSFKERMTARLARRSYPYVDAIVAISEGVKRDLLTHSSLTDDDIQVIYNPTVTPDLLEAAEEPVDHPWFNEPEPVVLGVGRLVDQKDFSTLIRSFAKLRSSVDAKLVILGDGDQRDQLEELMKSLGIESEVDLVGFVDNPYKYMAAADVFVNSAKHEGFGNVIVEALACKLPVVATDCPGAPSEILADGEYGRLVPIGDSDEMATAIAKTIDAPPEPAKLKGRAMDFSLDRSVDQYLSLLFEP